MTIYIKSTIVITDNKFKDYFYSILNYKGIKWDNSNYLRIKFKINPKKIYETSKDYSYQRKHEKEHKHIEDKRQVSTMEDDK